MNVCWIMNPDGSIAPERTLAEKTTDAYWLKKYGIGREPHEGFTLTDAQLEAWRAEEKRR